MILIVLGIPETAGRRLVKPVKGNKGPFFELKDIS